MQHDAIALYIGLIEAIDTPGRLESCRKILSPDERARADRFKFDRHRRPYIFAHALLRLALSEAAPQVAPADWSFAAARYGRPFIAAPTTPVPLHISLSHTEGCVACIVSTHEAVGVDVEQVTRGSVLETAKDIFAPEELHALRSLPPGEAAENFFATWTLKEAYLKARGFGLNLPLDKFALRISADHVAISFAPDIVDDPRSWRFTRQSPSPIHRLAIADGSGMGLPIGNRPVDHLWQLAEMA